MSKIGKISPKYYLKSLLSVEGERVTQEEGGYPVVLYQEQCDDLDNEHAKEVERVDTGDDVGT